MKSSFQKRSIRYNLEDLLYQQNGVLDACDMDDLVNGTNYSILFNSFEWFTNEVYIRKINEVLENFGSSFSLVEFEWCDAAGGLWVFKHH